MKRIFFKLLSIILSILIMINSFFSLKTINANDHIADLEIRDFRVSLIEGAELTNDNYIWNAQSSTEGHPFVFRVDFSLSGQYSIKPYDVEIRIPLHILKDRNDSFADSFEMSIPTKQDVDDGVPISADINYCYSIENNEIVIQNFREYHTGENAFIQIKFLTSKSTFDYKDNSKSDPFKASIKAKIINDLQEEVQVEATSNEIPVFIDTRAEIVETTKRTPDMYTEWDDSWGNRIEDAEKYYYLIWPIHTSFLPNLTQPYDFYLNEQPNPNRLLGSVVGYKMQGENAFSDNNSVSNVRGSSSRTDFVLTKHDKDLWDTVRENILYIENSIQARVHPIDKIDSVTYAYSTGNYVWRYEIPSFVYPIGHFMSHKRADRSYNSEYGFDYLGMIADEYSRYDLHKFKDGTLKYLNNLDYAVWAGGYPYPWTIGDKDDSDPNSYGSHKVLFEIIDETFILYEEASGFPNPNVGLDDDTYGIPVINDDTFVLDYNDFQIDILAFDVVIKDAYFKEESLSFIEKNSGTFLEDDVLHIYGRFNNDPNYIEIATKNLSTNKITVNDNYIESFTDKKLFFKDGVNCVGYKVITESNHYYINIKCVPNVRLKNSERVLNYIKDMDSIAILNSETANFYDYKGNKIANRSESEVDYITKSEDRTHSYIEKLIKSTSNSVNSRQYRINWNININDRLIVDNNKYEYIKQHGGTFYDLLPSGAILDYDSVSVYNGSTKIDNSYLDIKTIDNYNNSGRTLLVVDIDTTAEQFSLFFDTIHSWDVIFDWGNNIYNPAIYKTGNDEISEINPGYRGVNKQKDLFKDIIDEFGEKRFIYADTDYDISIISSAAANLHKKVKDSSDSDYSYDTWTRMNGDYSYRLRFQNTIATTSKDIVFFDSLENYPAKQADGSYLDSEWHGSLQSIDVSQLLQMGIKPEIYLSSVENLDIESNHDVSDNNVWKKASDFGDLSNAKAIAIDCRKNADGNDYILPSSASIQVVLYMKAPNAFDYDGTQAPRAFNNVYIEDTIIDSNGRETHFFIHQDYTVIRYRITRDLSIHKVNEEDTDQAIGDVSYMLKGTSKYGNKIEIVKTTNAKGNLTFKDIEQGEYELTEIDCPDDWLLDKTVHNVIVKNDGSLWIDEKQIDDLGVFTLTNTKRIHGDLKILKIKEGSTVKQKKIISEILEIKPKSNKTVKIDNKEFYVLVKDDVNRRALLAQNEPFNFLYRTENKNQNYINYMLMFWDTGSNKYIESGLSKHYNDQYLSDKPELSKMAIESEFSVYGSYWKRGLDYNEPELKQADVKTIITKVAPLSYSDFQNEDIAEYADYTYNNNYIISREDTFLWNLFKLTALRTTQYVWPFRNSAQASAYLLAYINNNLDHIAYANRDVAILKDLSVVRQYYPDWYPEEVYPFNDNPKDNTKVDYYVKTIPTFWVDLSGIDADEPISDTTFKLEGISDYGNDMTGVATSNEEGHLSFTNIEKGKYTLREISTNKDYVLNESIWDVFVNEDGSVTIKDPSFAFRDRLYHADFSNGEWIIHNEPRYWEFEIDKVLRGNHNSHISGVTFNLSGISDLNTIVDLNVTTDEHGIASFKRIEKGTYILKEISIDNNENNYYINNDAYKVKIDYTGKVTIPQLETKDKNSFYFENDIIQDGELIVTKKWNDNNENYRSIPKIHISTKQLDSLSSVDLFDENGVLDLGNGDFEYISLDSNWVKNGLSTQYYKFIGLDNSRKYYIYEEPMNGYTSEAIDNYIIVNEGELNNNVIIENNRTNVNKLYISKKVEPGDLYSASNIDGSIVLHSDNLDDNGLLLTSFRSTQSVLKHAKIEGAQMLDVVISAGFGGYLYVFSGDPKDPNSKAYNRKTSDADFVISRPLGSHEDNIYHFRIEGEDITIYYSSTYNTDYSDKYGFFASVKAVGLPNGTATIPESEIDKEFIFKICLDYVPNKTMYIDDVLFNDGIGYFKLKDGETKAFNNLPYARYYFVEVENSDNYISSYKTNSSNNHTVTNKYIDEEKAKLSIKKETTGNYKTQDSYDFYINLSNLNANTKYHVTNGESFESNNSGDAIYCFTLKADEEITINDIPYNAKYKITESGGDFISSYKIVDDNNGLIEKENDSNYKEKSDLSTSLETISKGEMNRVIFTNEINRYQQFSINKTVIGNDYDFDFEFDLLINNLQPNTYYESNNGRLLSDELGCIDRTIVIKHEDVFTIYDLPVNATYSVEEHDYVKDGFVSSVVIHNENAIIDNRKVTGTVIYGEDVIIDYTNVQNAVVSGSKTWLDGGLSHDNKEEIELELTRYSETTEKEIVNTEPIWENNTFYYLDLQLNDEYGNPYIYEVTEKNIEGYTSEVNGYNLINTRDKGSFVISKKVDGNDADQDKEFTFTIKLTNKDNNPVSGTFSGITFDENGVGIVKLKHNQEIQVELYQDINYEIKEDFEDYVPNIEVINGIVGNNIKLHNFINTKNVVDKPNKKIEDKNEITVSDYNKTLTYTITQTIPENCKYFVMKDEIPEELSIISYSINDNRLFVNKNGQSIKVECYDEEILRDLSNKQLTLSITVKINQSKLQNIKYINNTAEVIINNTNIKSNDTSIVVIHKRFENPKTGCE